MPQEKYTERKEKENGGRIQVERLYYCFTLERIIKMFMFVPAGIVDPTGNNIFYEAGCKYLYALLSHYY